jgi:hypothetical protein
MVTPDGAFGSLLLGELRERLFDTPWSAILCGIPDPIWIPTVFFLGWLTLRLSEQNSVLVIFEWEKSFIHTWIGYDICMFFHIFQYNNRQGVI